METIEEVIARMKQRATAIRLEALEYAQQLQQDVAALVVSLRHEDVERAMPMVWPVQRELLRLISLEREITALENCAGE